MSETIGAINLLPSTDGSDRKQKHAVQVANLLLFIVLFIASVAAAITWSIAIIIPKQISEEEQKISSLQQQILKLSEKEQKVQLLANRLTKAAAVLKSRVALEERLHRLLTVLPEGVSVSATETQESNALVKLSVTSATFDGFSQLLALLQSGKFTSVKVVDLARGKNGVYALDIEVTVQ